MLTKAKDKITGEAEKGEADVGETRKGDAASLLGSYDLTGDRIDFNPDTKKKLTEDLPAETVAIFKGALLQTIPSKKGPQPVAVVRRDKPDQSETVQASNLFFSTAYQASNFLMNADRFAWADKAIPSYRFSHETLRTAGQTSGISHLHPDAPTGGDYICSELVTAAECKAIFEDLSPEDVALALARTMRLWTNNDEGTLFQKSDIGELVGRESLPAEFALSGSHYAWAISVGLNIKNSFKNHGRSPASGLGKMFVEYLEEYFIDKNGFTSEAETIDYILSSPAELDDFVLDDGALDWLIERYKKKSIFYGKTKFPVDDLLLQSLKRVAKCVTDFTNLIDFKWGEKFEKGSTEALKERFGHPVGIPSTILKPFHFLYGGFLAESGWIKVEDGVEGCEAGLTANLPVDGDGKPNPSTSAWEKLSPVATLTPGASELARLGELAESLASGVEMWQVAYNRGLPRDSLYNAALLSLIDPNINGASLDDFSGTVRGLYHPFLKGIEFAVGPKMTYFPSVRSRVSAIARRLADKRTCPRGQLSLKEIDLSNWRLCRLSDNLCGNEYGASRAKSGAVEPRNFKLLGREYHENIQNKIRGFSLKEGIVTFAQPDDFVRPLIGRQRGEAMRIFIEKPGTYLRRTGCAELTGAALAVLDQIRNPLTPSVAYRDAAFGETTDCTTSVNHMPGHLSLNPYAFCPSGSCYIRIENSPENEGKTYNKFMTAGPGRRGENFPSRLRFASLSLGEKATGSGLIDPELGNLPNGGLAWITNIHRHVAGMALMTKDAPAFASELTEAPWHQPHLFTKDFELGEMGVTYKAKGENEANRLITLQKFLDGKYSRRQTMLYPGREKLAILHFSYSMTPDARLNFGDFSQTGPTLIKDGAWPHVRKQGLDHSVFVNMRRIGSFRVLFNAFREEEHYNCRYGDEFVSGEGFILGGRSGYAATGLENTPIRFGDAPPVSAAPYIKQWSKIVMSEGRAGAYLPEELRGQQEVTRNHFNRMVDKLTSTLSSKRIPNADLLISDSAFNHQTTHEGDFLVFWRLAIKQARNDERAMRTAQDTKGESRQDIEVTGAQLERETPVNGFEHLFAAVLYDYGKRGGRQVEGERPSWTSRRSSVNQANQRADRQIKEAKKRSIFRKLIRRFLGI